MLNYTRSYPSAQARAARGLTEAALDLTGWPWSRPLSLWLDVLVLLEEGAGL